MNKNLKFFINYLILSLFLTSCSNYHFFPKKPLMITCSYAISSHINIYTNTDEEFLLIFDTFDKLVFTYDSTIQLSQLFEEDENPIHNLLDFTFSFNNFSRFIRIFKTGVAYYYDDNENLQICREMGVSYAELEKYAQWSNKD